MYAAGTFDAPSDPGPSIQPGYAGAGRGRGKAGAGKGKEKSWNWEIEREGRSWEKGRRW